MVWCQPSELKFVQGGIYSHHFLYKTQDQLLQGEQEIMHEDDILVEVPGSAYALANCQESGDAAC